MLLENKDVVALDHSSNTTKFSSLTLDNRIRPDPIAAYQDSEEDDDQTTETNGTESEHLMMISGQHDQSIPSNPTYDALQQEMESRDDLLYHQNTYFMDGESRFISLPTLGSGNMKSVAQISRVFEEWLESKMCSKREQEEDTLPILEDSVEQIAVDILEKLKKQNIFTGFSKVLVKIRTGHVYTYHQLEDGQPLITQEMEEFFQQFPLFFEIIIRTTISPADSSQLLLMVENATVNPGNPYRLMEQLC